MDKNFVNIDDLVRQRLSGGEEQERSGAWLRMNELLDKEMPRDRVVGMMYWRRLFSAMAVLLLIGTITVGGYELSNTLKNHSGSDAVVASIAAAPSATVPSGNASSKNNEVTNSEISANGNINNENETKTNNKKHNSPIAATTTHSNTSVNIENKSAVKEEPVVRKEVAVTGQKDDQTAQPKALAANNNSVVKEEALVKKEVTAAPRNDKKAVQPQKAIAAIVKKTNNETKNTSNDNADSKVASDNAVASVPVGHKEVAKKKAGKEIALADNINEPGETKDAAKTAPSIAKHTNKAGKPEVIAKKTAAPKTTGADVTAMAGIDHETAAKKISGKKTEDQKMATLPLGSKAPAADSKTPVLTAGKAQSKPMAANMKLKAGKLALNAHAPAAKPIPVMTAGSIAGTKGTPVKENKAAKSAIAGTPVPNPLAAAKPAIDNVSKKQPVAVTAIKGKKVMQRLVLLERYIKISPNEGYYHLDTISMEEFTEEMGLAGEDKPYLPKSAKPGAGIASASGSNDNNSSANPQILPGATASATGKSAMGTKENAMLGKKSSGSSVMENLSAAFNDIKINASTAKFSMGLMGGINGTFFGPTSFKGFEFGLTGTVAFGNQWSVTTGLEYFHRINGNYAMNDNYYSYTQLSTGGYTKQEQTNMYSFSTLHSIEMPVAAKYTNGNFSFFAGGNFVYNFAINTGAAPLVPTGGAQYAQAVSNDNAPKLSANDFGARFGIGCLFGISYQVAPNVNLDLRNVQTLWNNAGTPGSKYVSDQLYKSPSLQLSLGYRLGGKAKK